MGYDSIHGKRVVVTGAAKGNGFAMAMAFARNGADVMLADVDEERLRGAVEEVRSVGGVNVSGHRTDVSQRTDVTDLMAATVDTLGGLDILINNAGVISRLDVLDITDQEWSRVLGVNLTGTFMCAQEAARIMVAGSGGAIVNISSMNAFIGAAHTAHYCASKGGAQALTKALAIALVDRGVRVNAIVPGAMETEMEDRARTGRLASVLERIPMKRLGQPSELTGAALYLASDESSYVTGSSITIDGGWLAT
jgi:glucose 1-dehydrogenase